MEDKDIKEFTIELVMIAEMLDKTLSEGLIELYFKTLKDLSLDQIRSAINHIANTATFFPKPVDFRNATGGNRDLQALTAWEKTRKAVRKVGRYESVQFNDPLIHSVISLMGGWEDFCSCEGYDGEKWQQHDFEKMYKTMVGVNRDHPEYLPGMSELDNSARGFDIRKPVLIGGEEKKQIDG